MGISELIRKLGPITEAKHISEFANKTAAIDIMSWLYKGLYACASNETLDKKSDLYLNYPLKMIAMLKGNHIEPIIVFDGKTLKEKQKIEDARKELRESNIEKANYLKNAGNEDESKKYMKRALKIKSRMLNTTIEILKQLDIKIIVAPYEADSQIAYLVRKNYADFAISEDSDLIALGVKDIVMKLTPEGNCMNINLEKFKNAPIDNYSDKLIRDLKNMAYVNFLELCVMSGCDYLASIKGFGLKTGLGLFEKYKKMESVFHEMKFIEKFKSKIPENYIDNAKKAVCMFFYQTVYDPKENKLVSLNSNNYENGDDLDRTFSKDYINRFVSQIIYKVNSTNNLEENLKSKKIFKNITEKINRELNSEGIDFPITQEDLFKLFGEDFPNSSAYCKGELDIKTLSVDKKIEQESSFVFYKDKYKKMFSYAKYSADKNSNENLKKKNELNDPILYISNKDVVNDNDNEYMNEEEIMKIINDEIYNHEMTKISDTYQYENSNNKLLNKKRYLINEYEFNEDNDNDYNNIVSNNTLIGNDKFKNTSTPILQTPEKSNFFNTSSKQDTKGAKNLLDLINKEKSAFKNTFNEHEGKEISVINIAQSPQKNDNNQKDENKTPSKLHPFFKSDKTVKNYEESPIKNSPISHSKLAPNFFIKHKHDEKFNKSLDFEDMKNSNELSSKKGTIFKSNFLNCQKDQKNNIQMLTNSGKKFAGQNSNILDFLQKK